MSTNATAPVRPANGRTAITRRLLRALVHDAETGRAEATYERTIANGEVVTVVTFRRPFIPPKHAT